MTDARAVATALLGSWPQHVATWGQEGISAYLSELEARGVDPERALVAIRSCPAGQKFPPSAPELAALARQDPGKPTFDEMLQGVFGPGGVFGFKRAGVEVSPWTLAFVERYGRERLRLLEIDDAESGHWRRKELREAWQQFLEATEGREVAAIAAGRRGQLGAFDPLAALNVPAGVRPEIGSGSPVQEAEGR